MDAAMTLCRLALREGLNVGCLQRVAADRPVPTLELIDANPRHRAHVLALDLDDRRGHLGDEVLFLLRGEDIFDHVDSCQRHVVSPECCMLPVVAAGGGKLSTTGTGTPAERLENSWRLLGNSPVGVLSSGHD